MANSLIPYSFIPGTKAMASEVNANFIALADAVDEGKTFTTESIEKFNKEFEKRLDESLDSKLETNLSNSKNISNCVIEIPKRIKIEISDGALRLKAGSVCIFPNGFEADGTTPKFDYITVPADMATDKPAYDRTNGIIYLSRDLSYVGDYPSAYSGNMAPTDQKHMLWYDTKTNFVKKSNDSGATWSSNLSLPIALANCGPNGYTEITQVFNGMGYIGQCTWVDKGVRCLFADGRNPDGTLKNLEVISEKIMIEDTAGRTSIFGRLSPHNNALVLLDYGAKNYFEQDTMPADFGQYAIWYNSRENRVYKTSDSGQTWNEAYHIVIPQLQKLSKTDSITSIKIPYIFKAADINDVLKRISVTGILKSDNNYVKFGNGMIVQWGKYTNATPDSGNVTITLPTPFSGTNYTAIICPSNMSDWFNEWGLGIRSQTASNFVAYTKIKGYRFNWIAIGY